MTEILNIRGYEVTIERDEIPQSPDEYEPDRVFIYADSKHLSVTAMKERMEKEGTLEDYDELPLYAHVHGSITISSKPFTCGWDSGRIGSIYVRPGAWCAMGEEHEEIEAWIAMWNQYLSGDVWDVAVKNRQGEVIESCGSIYGIIEARREAHELVPDESDETMSECEARKKIAEAVKRCLDRIPKELVDELTKPLKYAGV